MSAAPWNHVQRTRAPVSTPDTTNVHRGLAVINSTTFVLASGTLAEFTITGHSLHSTSPRHNTKRDITVRIRLVPAVSASRLASNGSSSPTRSHMRPVRAAAFGARARQDPGSFVAVHPPACVHTAPMRPATEHIATAGQGVMPCGQMVLCR